MIVENLKQEQRPYLTEKHFQHSNKISIANRLQTERSGFRFPAEARVQPCSGPHLAFYSMSDGITCKILSFNDELVWTLQTFIARQCTNFIMFFNECYMR